MRRALVLVIVTGVLPAAAQVERFEVASVRRGGIPQAPALISVLPGGRVSAPNSTLRELIRAAYGLDDNQIVGGPDWMGVERYAVEAIAPSGDVTNEQVGGLLRALLAERFGLVTRRETRDLPVYVLQYARADRRLGPRIRPAGAECAPVSPPPGMPLPPPPPPGLAGAVGRRTFWPAARGFRCPVIFFPGWFAARAVTMAQLAPRLTTFVDRPVIDRTALAGEFDFDLAYTPERPPVFNGIELPPTADGASLFTALREQLGLTLDAQRGPIDVLVVDRAERATEN